ncbi:protein of unknown function [Taphrina deformans PYCC 5710]|uniref:Endoplasmic oxidoreductin-1 n=1 Tax=Taphrina deformans (strain PYCC 5710 / ATCC 11124 / CBS 356.35 / IMI 108563 / JCM 9778 / NBRC 8474) TaxID=1097556 RepID=R4XD22_TAPDE|nr:protein of unknown function [Taphrina deformans PYCC 5710]|eukprot:CCG83776.1 protein of unknown function [Taphrina deformans PYCC 5710]
MRSTLFLPFLAPALVSGSTQQQNQIADTTTSYTKIDKHNEVLSPLLRTLCSSADFFKYYKLNLFTKECPYFSEDGAFCGNRACAVDTVEEDEVPEPWRASVLGKLSGPTGTAASNLPLHTAPSDHVTEEQREVNDLGALVDSTGETCVQDPVLQDDKNYCVAEEEESGCVYVSLVDNEERYTNYHGSHAHAIWGSIYKENCFESHRLEEFVATSDGQETPVMNGLAIGGLDSGYGESRNSKAEFAQNLRDPLMSGQDAQDTCVEKRIFYRIISGMHASISAHICASYLNQLSGKWEPNVTCFNDRLRSHPERVSNIYFNYVLVSRAVAKLGDYLTRYTFCSGDPARDVYTSRQVKAITSLASDVHYDESSLFEDRTLKEDFRNRFRNISMLMDCVGCDKCRLWGKVQTAGYGTALKILFDESPDIALRRGEVVALFNTYGRLSISLDALRTFNYSAPGTTVSGHVQDRVQHARPATPLDQAVTSLESLKCKLAPLANFLPTRSSLWRSLKSELGEFGRALKFIGKSYVDLPRNLWYQFFVKQRHGSLWDFAFTTRQDDREL